MGTILKGIAIAFIFCMCVSTSLAATTLAPNQSTATEANTPSIRTQPVQSQLSVSASNTAETPHATNILHNMRVWLSGISAVIWAAVIASGLTYIGVFLTNRGNRKCLLLQLDHAAKQKDKEREMQIRKETYIEAVEAIAKAIKDVQRLPSRLVNSNDVEIADQLLAATAKVHMVGTLDTIKAVCQFMEDFNQHTFPIIPNINIFLTLKQEVTSLNNLAEYQANSLKETDSKIEKADSEGNKNLGIYNRMFDELQKKYESTIATREIKVRELSEFQPKLLSMCLQTAAYLQKKSLSVTICLRKELNIEIDNEKYIAEIDKAFKTYSNHLSPENIEKLIRGNRQT